jgi:Glycosyl transferases group 1
MKVVVLRTYSLSCVPIYEPLRALGHEIVEIVYCPEKGPVSHAELPSMIDAAAPDWTLMIGQHDDGLTFVPPPHILAEIAGKRPTVHLCCDGSERVWWPQLESYRECVPFALHVNIDGVRTGFFAEHGLTTLCPIDATPFAARRPLMSRAVRVGFCGGWGDDGTHSRGSAVAELLRRGVPVHAVKRPFVDYADYRQFLMTCRCVWNHAATGTDDHMHVKARVVEAALAGALLLEQDGSPAQDWFVPGEDYLTWRDADDVAAVARFVENSPNQADRIASRLTAKVVARHAAAPFWRQVLAQAGIKGHDNDDIDHAAVAL